MSGITGAAKVVLDVVGALTLLVLLSPVLLALALALRLDGGPALFRQTRVGLDGRIFRMYKFRSMTVDAEAGLPALDGVNEGAGPLFKMRLDPRVTPIGAVLRRYSLDELPQLLNVVSGSMSLVGPRPALPWELSSYCPRVQRRLTVRPGMTGLWQVSGRSNLSWDESVLLDLRYVDEWGHGLDVRILARTFRAVLVGNGAY